MAVSHASPRSAGSLGFISITFSNPCHFTLAVWLIENEGIVFEQLSRIHILF